jgi:hypothetical protein
MSIMILIGIVGILLLKLLKENTFKKILLGLTALGVGSLLGDATLLLLPEVKWSPF